MANRKTKINNDIFITKEGNNFHIQFFWNGIKVNGGKLHRIYYSNGTLCNYPEGTFTMYAKDYERLPKVPGLTIHNDTDSMTDYFEKDRVRITPDNIFHSEVSKAFQKAEAHREKMNEKRNNNR